MRTTLLTLLFVLLAAVLIGVMALRNADGPKSFIAGGEFTSGEWVVHAVDDWSFAHGKNVELQLMNPASSRTTGIMLHKGELYIPCDLGFMWNRFTGQTRWLLNLIYWFKDWHHAALADRRVVLRIDGKRYARQAVLVKDPQLIEELKIALEQMASEFFTDVDFSERPTKGPNDIWFFRLDPRGFGMASESGGETNRYPMQI